MATKPKSPKPTGPLCVISINFEHYLMPQADALKVAALMGDAVHVRPDYSSLSKFVIVGDADIRFESVKASQIRAPADEADDAPRRAKPLAIAQSPLSLEFKE